MKDKEEEVQDKGDKIKKLVCTICNKEWYAEKMKSDSRFFYFPVCNCASDRGLKWQNTYKEDGMYIRLEPLTRDQKTKFNEYKNKSTQ